jgi:V8-like Glu-specific endopeptidase
MTYFLNIAISGIFSAIQDYVSGKITFLKPPMCERTIHYLQSKENAQGENALALFIRVLSERYLSHHERHDLLLTIIHKLQPTTLPTQLAEQHSILAEANPLQEPMLAISELEQIRRCARSVALIEVTRYRKGKDEYRETGTGWLLAPGLVLTCWHVVAALASAEKPPPAAIDLKSQIKHMILSFNHIEISKGGIQYKVSALEYPLNETDQQDFAILRLEDRSDQPHRPFGYLSIELDTPFTKQTQLSIIQHPFGQHQQIAVNGHFVSHSRRAGRILYTTVTEKGTSGAPVLNHYNLRAVALHNGENREAQFRDGISHKCPICHIRLFLIFTIESIIPLILRITTQVSIVLINPIYRIPLGGVPLH